jgi:hypothetical protein
VLSNTAELGSLPARAFMAVALLAEAMVGGYTVSYSIPNRLRRWAMAGDCKSISVQKSMVLKVRSKAGGPHIQVPSAR